MKLLYSTVFSIVLFCFCFYETQSNVLAKPTSTSSGGYVLELNLISGVFYSNISAQLNLYAIKSPKPLPLPINVPKGIDYLQYKFPAKAKAYNATFNNLSTFPSGMFNTSTYIAFELWDSPPPPQTVERYLGGVVFTSEQIRLMPHGFNLVLADNQQQNVGSILLTWTSD